MPHALPGHEVFFKADPLGEPHVLYHCSRSAGKHVPAHVVDTKVPREVGVGAEREHTRWVEARVDRLDPASTAVAAVRARASAEDGERFAGAHRWRRGPCGVPIVRLEEGGLIECSVRAGRIRRPKVRDLGLEEVGHNLALREGARWRQHDADVVQREPSIRVEPDVKFPRQAGRIRHRVAVDGKGRARGLHRHLWLAVWLEDAFAIGVGWRCHLVEVVSHVTEDAVRPVHRIWRQVRGTRVRIGDGLRRV
mmetsp:Transcript_34887/g.116598  ORF Transcript_34887/g.116598 Transcript_34887/m.116598 type:complete len:251 (-) Transcript_34887:1576-2328(-)